MKLLDMMIESHKGNTVNAMDYYRTLAKTSTREQNKAMSDYQEWKTTLRQGKQFKSVREEKKWQLKDIRNLTNIKLKRL
ncbi:hypothetical protein [Carnobacterium maltaromaticum]|uniref:hypothetical protein n=1 Tax=Carnobacterium maltaromaticum TaxID=2751 RepID=UPI00215342CB|nr:hypothetical protein [Carnobacterium maltaromaticum]